MRMMRVLLPPPYRALQLARQNKHLVCCYSYRSRATATASLSAQIDNRPNNQTRVRASSSSSSPQRASSSSSSSSHHDARSSRCRLAAISLSSLAMGYIAGQVYPVKDRDHSHLPDGLPRTCCDDEKKVLTAAQQELPAQLRRIVGHDNVIDGQRYNTVTMPFLQGARLGRGPALCIVTPRRLRDVVDVVQAIVDADCVVLPQGQNTGLTGGSVPRHSDRPVVLLSMKHLHRVFPLDQGTRVCCLAGVGLAQLSRFVRHEFDRETHSQLGSTFLNPTVAAGVALGSGGTQCRQGPAYTERALYLRIHDNKWQEKQVEIVDTLHIANMHAPTNVPPERLRKLDSIVNLVDQWSKYVSGGYERTMRYTEPGCTLAASDVGYTARLCQHDHTVSRYNADTRGPDCNRSEGKIILLATIHDTFARPLATKTYWISFDTLDTALAFRQQVCLHNAKDVPVSAEYLDRDAYDVIDRSGRVLGSTIKALGPAHPIVRRLWNVKLWIEAWPVPGAATIVDHFLHFINPVWPRTLSTALCRLGETWHHHVAMTVGEYGDGNMQRLVDRMQQFQASHPDSLVIHECRGREAASVHAFRFVAAPAFRTWCVGEHKAGISVDYALPKNNGRAPPIIMPDSAVAAARPVKRMRYSHFACNVVHEDIAYEPSVDTHVAKHDFKHVVEQLGGKLPAEHGHGTEYVAPAGTQARWRRMDPLNVCNPGVGHTPTGYKYRER